MARAPGRLDDLARHLGRPSHITAGLVAVLARRGLVRHTTEHRLLTLPGAGSVALAQINGMQIRLLDRIATALGPDGPRALHHALHDLPAALEVATARVGPSRQGADGAIRST